MFHWKLIIIIILILFLKRQFLIPTCIIPILFSIKRIVLWIKWQGIVNVVIIIKLGTGRARWTFPHDLCIWILECRIEANYFHFIRWSNIFKLLFRSLNMLFQGKFIQFWKYLSSQLSLTPSPHRRSSFLSDCQYRLHLRWLVLWWGILKLLQYLDVHCLFGLERILIRLFNLRLKQNLSLFQFILLLFPLLLILFAAKKGKFLLIWICNF